jgi:ATP-binding cassette, subfamily B, bacterial IrtA/YbtP
MDGMAQPEAAGGDRATSGSQSPVSLGAVAKRLLTLMRDEPFCLAGAVISSTLAALLSLSTHIAVALALIALVRSPLNWQLLNLAAGIGISGMILRHVLFALATSLSHGIAFRTQAKLRLHLAEKLALVPLGFLDDHSKGGLRTTLVDDVEGIEDGMAHMVPEIGAAIIMPFVALALLFWIDWRLAILTLIPVSAGMFLLGSVMKRGEQATRDYFVIQSKMNEVTGEIADALPTVRAFNQDQQATKRAARVFADMTRFSNRWMKEAVVPASFAQILLTSHLLLAAPAGFVMAANGLIDLPHLAAFVAIAFGLGDVFAAFQGVSHRLMRQVQMLERIDDLLGTREMPVRHLRAQPETTRIEAEVVSFSYGPCKVLDEVSFTLEPGKCLALVGPSGSGKSTLAKLIGRFHDVDDGVISLGGIDLRELGPDMLHKHIAFVFQDVFLFSGTIAENIRLGRIDADMDAVIAAAHDAKAHEFITRLPDGYETIIGERGLSLSSGEKQRISIARAILKDAPVLILDEATSFADPENEAQIQNAIATLARGRSLVVIAHRLHTIAHADEILVLDRGRIVERGDLKSLVNRNGLFARMWASQNAVYPGFPTQTRAAE